MALLMLLVGAVSVVGGIAMLSVQAATICGGAMLMAGAVAVAAAQDRAGDVQNSEAGE